MSMSAKGRMGAVVALLLLAAAFLLWPARDAHLPDDTPKDTTDASPHVPGPGLVGQDASGGAQSNASEPDVAVAEDTPDASWKLNFTVEGAPGWQRASFVPVHNGSVMGTSAGDTVSRTGSLRVSGDGRLVIRAPQRVPWISEVLHAPESGTREVTANLSEGLTVSGAVVAADGETPVSSGYVRMRQSAPLDAVPNTVSINSRVWLDERGRFHMTGLYPGRVRVSVTPVDLFGIGVDVEAQAGDDLTIRMKARGKLHLTLSDAATGKAPDTLYVRIWYRTTSGVQRMAMQPMGIPDSVPVVKDLDHVLCGEAFRLTARADGYEPFPIDVLLPPLGGSQTHEIRMVPDPNAIVDLTLALHFQGKAPQQILVTRHAPKMSSSMPEVIRDGRIQLHLDPELTQVVIGHIASDSDWAAVVIPLDKSTHGTARSRDITMRKGGNLQFPKSPPANVALERDGERFTRFATADNSTTVPAIYPGLWAYRIEGDKEIWTGEAIIRSGETTLATPTIERK